MTEICLRFPKKTSSKLEKELEKLKTRFEWLTCMKTTSDQVFSQLMQDLEFQAFIHKKIREGITMRKETEGGKVKVKIIKKL